ncbi:synaptotagmin-14 [Diachasma alloeum]|uniref:synaptotagmin-14 n=1 Tax=Diachasma alloeum TaxID=454923 RepID=UPI0007382F3B|nr:synaptotagmin-14 [Diachasma alloeum]
MILTGSDHFLAGPVGLTAFLGTVAGFVTLLLVLFLYLSKKWALTPVPQTTLFGGICVPLNEPTECNANTPVDKSLGKVVAYSDPETSSDSEEDALRRLQTSHSHVPLPDTLTIQTEDSPTVVDTANSCSSCPDEHTSDQHECVVDVGSPSMILESRGCEDEEEEVGIIEEVCTPSSDEPRQALNEAIDEFGCLEVAFLYDAPMREMTVQVLQGKNYPAGIGGSQVRLVLLPSKKQRRKTRVRQGCSPQYMESFLLPRVNPEDVNAMGVRMRVYQWSGRMRRERLLGEARVCFDQINLQLETILCLPLQPPPRSSVHDWGTTTSLTRSDSTGSQQSVQSYASPTTPPYGSSMKGGSIAEILIGLAYNGTTGRLSVEIIKGSHFRGGGGSDTKPPDTYVKLTLVDSNGHEMGRSKTGLRRAQPNPLYKETFIFQVALFQLGDVTLFISVYNRRRSAMGKKGREMIGWLCLGLNSSGPEELQHWNDMRSARSPKQLQRWHSLLRP